MCPSILIFILSLIFPSNARLTHPSPFATIRGNSTPSISNNITDPAFIPYKTMAGTIAYAHAAVTININEIVEEAKAICICNNQKDLFKEYSVRKMHFQLLQEECEYAESFVEQDLAFIFERKRDERFVASSAIGGALVITSLIGLFNTYQINQIESSSDNAENIVMAIEDHEKLITQLRNKNNEMMRLISLQKANNKKFFDYNEQMWYLDVCNAHIKKQTQRLKDLRAALIDLVHGRISPDIITPNVAEKTLRKLGQRLKLDGYELALDGITQFYQLPNSFVIHKDGIITSLVHVPLFAKDSMLQLFKYRSIPVKLGKSKYYFTINTDSKYLAINHDHTFMKEITQEELDECQQTANILYCDNQNIMERPHLGTCTTALYADDINSIRDHCEITAEERHTAIQTGPHTFVLYLPTPTMVHMRCYGSRPFNRKIKSKGLQQLTLPDGCMATTKYFKVASQGSVTTTARSEEYKPNYSFTDIFNVTEEYTEIFDTVIQPSERIKIRNLRKQFHLKTIHPFWTPTPWTNLSITTIGIAVLTIYILQFLKQRKGPPEIKLRRCHEDI
jgi:hypothetical protein